MEAKYVLLGCFFLFFLGCTSQTQTQFVCADGTSVSDPSLCPPGEIAQTWSSSNAYVCPDGSKVGSPVDCSSCPSTCDDGNPCTDDICGLDTEFSCIHDSLNGQQPNCQGPLNGCLQSTCSSGSCISEPQVPCCGNGKCEQGETCSSCATDCGCEEGDLCCENKCRGASCSKDYDCSDGNEATLDKCTGTGCEAACEHLAITSCESGDGACPNGCNFLNDTDCPSYGLRHYGNITDNLTVSVLSKATRHCFGQDKDQGKDYGYFLVITADFENKGFKEIIIPTNEFTVFSNSGKQYSPIIDVPGDCDTSGMFAGDTVKVLSYKHQEGEVWFELGKTEIKCGFVAVLNRSAYGEAGELVWNVPC